MHGCDNDLKYLAQDLGTVVTNLVDTAKLDCLAKGTDQYRSLGCLA